MKKRISKLFEFKFELRSLGSRSGLNEEDKGPGDYLREGIEHFNNYSQDACLVTFEVLMEKFPEYLKGRVVYSSVLEKFGMYERSVRVLCEDIQAHSDNMDDKELKNQFIMHIEAGKLHYRIHKNYGKISQHIMGKKKYLETALKFFRDSKSFAPGKLVSLEMEAECLESLEKHDEAVKLWEQLKNKKEGKYLKRYASSLEFLGNQEKTVEEFTKLAEGTNDGFAYERLAFYNKDKQKKAELKQKSEFYKWIPSYITKLEFTQENYGIFKTIVDRNKEYSLNTKVSAKISKEAKEEDYYQKFLDCVKNLIENNNLHTSCFLVTIIHNHCGGTLVNKAFTELDKRAKDKEVQEMIFNLIASRNKSPCVVKNSVAILAKQKYSALYNTIIKHLSSDMNIFHKGLPMALAHLGNKEAVPHLVASLNLEFTKNHQKTASGIASLGHLKLRQRCALALGFFKDTRGLKACREGLKIKPLRLYCAAALYKMSDGDKRWLKPIRSSLKKKRYVGHNVFVYLKEYCTDVDELLEKISKLYEEKSKGEMNSCM